MIGSKRVTILVTAFLLFSTCVATQAQNSKAYKDSVWTTGGNVGLFLQQVGVSNWAGGGQNSLSYGMEANLFANKQAKLHTWENGLQAGYGLIKQGDQETRKNNDVLIVTSKYGRFITKKWQLSGGVDFRTQFDDGFDYEGASDGTDTLISTFMAPGYLSPYVGATYKPKKSVSMTIAPVMGKFTFVLDDRLSELGAYGVDPGSKVRSQVGASFNGSYQKEIMQNVNLKTSLLLFAAYNDISHVDVNFDLFLNFKVNEFITTNFSVQAIYDDDIDIEDEDGNVGPRLQLRNILNVGITFNFGDELED
ncbi:MAG: DUF3078 domain-containing protein [Fulvivirga sp.]